MKASYLIEILKQYPDKAVVDISINGKSFDIHNISEKTRDEITIITLSAEDIY